MLAASTGCSHPSAPVPAAAAAPASVHPDLSGFWDLDMKVPRDRQLMAQVAPNTVFLDDTGPVEFPAGQFGGLKLKPAALEAARQRSRYEQLQPENPCKPPSIVYAM